MIDKNASKQEVFDYVVRHCFKQGQRSIEHTEGCMYRDKTGRKCAIGALIPDDKYNPYMDVNWTANDFFESGILPDCVDRAFFNRLQEAHDGDIVVDTEITYAQMEEPKYLKEYWRLAFAKAAETLGLNAEVLNEL